MKRPPGVLPVPGRSFPAAHQAWHGLATVFTAADPAPVWRSPWHRRAVHAALTAATLACCGYSLAGVAGLTGPVRLTELAFWVPAKAAPRAQVINGAPAQAIPPPLRAQRVVAPAHGLGALARVQAHVVTPHILPGGFDFAHGWLNNPSMSLVLAAVVGLAVVAPLPLVARYPLMGWRIGWLGLLLVPLADMRWWHSWPWGPVQLLVVVVVFGVAGVRSSRAGLWWMWVLTLGAWWVQAAGGRPGVLPGVAGSLVLSGVAVAADALGAWRRARQALASQAELTELEQARRAVLEERAKIARELHDVVAHHMSLIAVRAETAPYRLAGLDAGAVAEFASLSGGARSALADMRRLLGVLRHDEPAALAPAPQLADLPALIEGARRAGLGVALRQVPAPAAVPPPVGVCAYRIVQESLSNASRHAPGAPVTVTIGHDDDTVMLRVENGPVALDRPAANGRLLSGGQPGGDGGPAATMHSAGSGRGPVNGRGAASGHLTVNGHGLAGMRERVALLGGSLSAGPSPDGGFVVSAILPLGEAA